MFSMWLKVSGAIIAVQETKKGHRRKKRVWEQGRNRSFSFFLLSGELLPKKKINPKREDFPLRTPPVDYSVTTDDLAAPR